MVLYCIALYCIALYCIVLYCTALYCIALYCIALYCIALYCIALYCIAQYCLHCTDYIIWLAECCKIQEQKYRSHSTIDFTFSTFNHDHIQGPFSQPRNKITFNKIFHIQETKIVFNNHDHIQGFFFCLKLFFCQQFFFLATIFFCQQLFLMSTTFFCCQQIP